LVPGPTQSDDGVGFDAEEGASAAMSKLRDKIGKYEAETGTEVKCFAGLMRCLPCPVSAIGCAVARRSMK
jgi:hypothetical protein